MVVNGRCCIQESDSKSQWQRCHGWHEDLKARSFFDELG